MPLTKTFNSSSLDDNQRSFLNTLFEAAVLAADPMRVIPKHLPQRPSGRVFVIGAGKASARMAEAVESVWENCEGMIVTRDGYSRPLKQIKVVEASHPVPDERGNKATAQMVTALRSCNEDCFVLALISGGGSSLLSMPAGDITLQEEQALTTQMLASGAPINEMNELRRHLSLVKGGKLAVFAAPAKVLSLIISDVPGDKPEYIASGPTVPQLETPKNAIAIAAKWEIDLTPSMLRVLENQETNLTDKNLIQANVENVIVAAPSHSLEAARKLAVENGWDVRLLGDAIEGEARIVANEHARLALELQNSKSKDDKPILLLSGGECTVTNRGNGVGGPNAEYCLSLAIALNGKTGISAISCDTDGVDGAAEVAGAFVDETTLARAAGLSVSAKDYLSENNSHSFFEKLGDQIVPGPTLTNVNDFRAIAIF